MRWWVVTEHGATFAVRPGVEAHRPRQRTPIDGCSWRATGPTPAGRQRWKARSGAATWRPRGSSQILDRPTRLVRPGLRTGLLARWLFGAGEIPSGRPEEVGRATGLGDHYTPDELWARGDSPMRGGSRARSSDT